MHCPLLAMLRPFFAMRLVEGPNPFGSIVWPAAFR
jgi:hypothetical protein